MATITAVALVALTATAGATATAAAEVRDAEVLAVEPIYEAVLTPVSRRQCWKRSTAAADGARDTGSAAVARHCVTAWQPAWRQALTGYRVKYRYRGRVGVTRTDRHPGERIRVQPRLQAIHF